MGSYHALLSPSSADRWTSCTASVSAQVGRANEGNDASRLGTACHQICEEVLRDGAVPQSYLGRALLFWTRVEDEARGEDWADDEAWERIPLTLATVQHRVPVTQEMIDAVVSATEFVQSMHLLHGGELHAEQQVPIGHFTGEKDARGTTDVLLFTGDTVHVLDFKFGRHKVNAYEVVRPASTDIITGETVPEVVRANLQMACYALGALEKYGAGREFKHVTMTIVQPFISHVSEYTCTVAELLEVRDFLAAKAEETRTNPQFVPSADNCHFCPASGNCEAQTRMVIDTAVDGFEDVDTAKPKEPAANALGSLYAVIPLVQDWCKAVESRVRAALVEGRPVVRNDGFGYKLVEGKNTARQWKDTAEAEAALKKMRLKVDQMYETSLISPTTAEKLSKSPRVKKGETPLPPVLGPTQWDRLQGLIVQGKGQPVIALETDPRPAVAPATEGFDDVPPADNSDLF